MVPAHYGCSTSTDRCHHHQTRARGPSRSNSPTPISLVKFKVLSEPHQALRDPARHLLTSSSITHPPSLSTAAVWPPSHSLHTPAALQWLCFQARMLFTQSLSRLVPSPPSGLCSKPASSERPSLGTPPKAAPFISTLFLEGSPFCPPTHPQHLD